MDYDDLCIYQKDISGVPRLTIDQINSIVVLQKIFDQVYIGSLSNHLIFIKYFSVNLSIERQNLIGAWDCEDGKTIAVYYRFSRPKDFPYYFPGKIFYRSDGVVKTLNPIDQSIYDQLFVGKIFKSNSFSKYYEAKLITSEYSSDLVIKTPITSLEITISDIVASHNLSPRIYGFWKTQYSYALITERIYGIPLDEYLKSAPNLTRLFREVGKSLLYLNLKLSISYDKFSLEYILIVPLEVKENKENEAIERVYFMELFNTFFQEEPTLVDFDFFIREFSKILQGNSIETTQLREFIRKISKIPRNYDQLYNEFQTI